MGHLTTKTYRDLFKRMDQFAPGVHDSDTLRKILSVLFTEEEAKLCSVMRLVPSSVNDIAKLWGKTEEEAETILDNLADKGLVYDDIFASVRMFTLSIPVLGFFEFSLMRTDGRFDHEVLSELYHQYVNVDEGFIREYAAIDPPISRVYAQEESIEDVTSEVLSHETARRIIDDADYVSVGMCYCRHKMEHLGRACDAIQEACLTFGGTAASLVKHGIARQISREEAHSILETCIDQGLAQIGDNVRQKPAVICNCCGCCCDLLLAYKKLGISELISPSNYLAAIDQSTCTHCGMCLEKCPADAIIEADGNYLVNKSWCLGCGVCTRFCEPNASTMKRRPKDVFVPRNLFERLSLAAVYQGKLGNFLFDNQKSVVHGILRKLLNAFIRLPGIRHALLNRKINAGMVRLILKLKNLPTE